MNFVILNEYLFALYVSASYFYANGHCKIGLQEDFAKEDG